MTEAQGIAFLQALRASQIRVKGNGWIEASCVLAPWFHAHHTDTRPSFGLSIHPGERSHFSCFSCKSGSAHELVQMLELYTHYDPSYAFAQAHALLSDELQVVPLPPYSEFPQAQAVMQPWPEYWLDSFPSAVWSLDAMAYLTGRGVTALQAESFNLRFDTKRQMVVAPYWDVFGRFAGARGRSILAAGQKHFDYSYQGTHNCRWVWYGEPVLNAPGPVVVVEGQFDAIRVSEVFPKVVAALTAKPTWDKFKKLADCGMVVQIPDRDTAGQESIAKYADFCQQLGVRHRVLHLDEGVKDPAEAHPDYLKDRIHAVLSPA